MNLFLSCASGLGQVLKKELQILGYKPTILKPTLLTFPGDEFAIAQTNIRLRTANKVYLEIASQRAETFDQLFDFVYAQDRSKYIGNTNFIVKASSSNSKLFSTPTIQSISEKAIHKKIVQSPSSQKSIKSDQETLQTFDFKTLQTEVLILLDNNTCTILLNTSGESLHKRGYKLLQGDAPLNEALAAGLILLSGRKFHETFYDFFCGSGTIPIEAAMIAKNIAPGAQRKFAFQNWKRYDQTLFEKAKKLAQEKIMTTKQHTIIATDHDPKMIEISQENAERAGVENYIQFEIKDLKDRICPPGQRGVGGIGKPILGTIVSNPPYGLRMHPEDLKELYQDIATLFTQNEKINGGIITSYEKFSEILSSSSLRTKCGNQGGATGPQSGGRFGSRKKTPFYNGGSPCRFFKKSNV